MPIQLTPEETITVDAALTGDLNDPVALIKEAGEDVTIFFQYGRWRNQDFRKSDITHVSFKKADLRGAKFTDEQLKIVVETQPKFMPGE